MAGKWWTARALCLLPCAIVAASASVAAHQSATLPVAEPVQVRVELDGEIAAPSWFAMSAPDRLVIDLPGGRAEAQTQAGHGAVRKLRLAQFDRKTARMVIELTGPARVQSAVAQDGAVVVTLMPTTAADFARLPRLGRFAAVAPRSPSLPSVAFPSLPWGNGQRSTLSPPWKDPGAKHQGEGGRGRPLVVIDPGHGGKDVGAISAYEGRFEKDATLAIARAIKRELERGGEVRARLTRDDDRFIELGERVAIARRAGAALFLSVHCDSAPNAAAHGATVYTLSDVASDRMAARSAARENRSDALAGVDLGVEEPEVATILYDLTRRGAMNASAGFAESLQRAMQADVAFTGNYHRFAGFRVLKTADMPAALLETGYVTNEDDARFLFSAEGQRAIARGVRAAIEAQLAPRLMAASAHGVEGEALNR